MAAHVDVQGLAGAGFGRRGKWRAGQLLRGFCGEQKENSRHIRVMAMRTCCVTITDLEGIAHTVEMTASALFEAVALGPAALCDSDWVAGIPEGLAAVRVSVTSIPIEHTVKMQDFTNWVERKGGSPKDVSNRDRIRAILGLPR